MASTDETRTYLGNCESRARLQPTRSRNPQRAERNRTSLAQSRHCLTPRAHAANKQIAREADLLMDDSRRTAHTTKSSVSLTPSWQSSGVSSTSWRDSRRQCPARVRRNRPPACAAARRRQPPLGSPSDCSRTHLLSHSRSCHLRTCTRGHTYRLTLGSRRRSRTCQSSRIRTSHPRTCSRLRTCRLPS